MKYQVEIKSGQLTDAHQLTIDEDRQRKLKKRTIVPS